MLVQLQTALTTRCNPDKIDTVSFRIIITNVRRAGNSVHVAVLLNAARTMDETVGDVLARSVLHVRQADRLVEHLRSGVTAVQFDEDPKPVDSK